MHISSKGQITIPLEIRNQFGLFPDTEVEFIKKGNEIVLKKLKVKTSKEKRSSVTCVGKLQLRCVLMKLWPSPGVNAIERVNYSIKTYF